MSATRWTLHRLDRSLGEHAQAWDALRQRLYRPNPVLSASYFNALLASYAEGNEYLCIASALEAPDEPLAMCVLQACNALVWRSFLPAQAPLGPTLISDPELVQDLFRALPRSVVQIDLLCADEDFGNLAVRSFASAHCLDHALTMSVDLRGQFGNYWRARSRTLSKKMRRYHNRAADDGVALRHALITSPAEMPAAVDRYAALEAAGWKGRLGTAVGSSESQRQLYQQLMLDMAGRGQAKVWELWAGEELAASRLTIQESDTLVILKTTYNEKLAAYTPGRLQLQQLVEDAFSLLPGGRLEFFTNASEDQLRWASSHRWIRHLSFYRHPLLRTLAAGLGATRQLLRFAPEGAGQPGEARQNIRVFERFEELPAGALHLLEQAEQSDFQFGADWYRNLAASTFQEPGADRLRIYVLGEGEATAAVLPLRVDAAGREIRAFSNFYTALHAPALKPGVSDRQLAQLLRRVRADHPGLRSLQLSPMAPEHPSFRSLQSALKQANLACFSYFCFGNWYQPVQEPWEAYLRQRDGRLRSTISRMGRKFTAAGGRLETLCSPAEAEHGLAAYERVYAVSWKNAEPFPHFIPGLVRMAAQRGWLRLGVAWINDTPVAAQIWIVSQGKANVYKLAYDEEFRSYSPGTLLTARLMQHVMDVDQVSEVDYLIGDDGYKREWMSSRRTRWGLVAYNPASLRGLLGLVRELLGRAARHLTRKTAPGQQGDPTAAAPAGMPRPQEQPSS
jgi:CelD/BcsL family acetyltransferase involved in cellulose biosynthesis